MNRAVRQRIAQRRFDYLITAVFLRLLLSGRAVGLGLRRRLKCETFKCRLHSESLEQSLKTKARKKRPPPTVLSVQAIQCYCISINTLLPYNGILALPQFSHYVDFRLSFMIFI